MKICGPHGQDLFAGLASSNFLAVLGKLAARRIEKSHLPAAFNPRAFNIQFGGDCSSHDAQSSSPHFELRGPRTTLNLSKLRYRIRESIRTTLRP